MPNGEPFIVILSVRRYERAEDPVLTLRSCASSASRRMPLVASVGLSAQPVHEPDPDILAAKRMLSSGPPDEGYAECESLISGPSSAAKTRSGSR